MNESSAEGLESVPENGGSGGPGIGGNRDGDVIQHVGPLSASVGSCCEDDMEGDDEATEHDEDAGDLEGIVNSGDWPVGLEGKEEVEEEDAGEGEDDARDEDLDWERTGEFRLIGQVRVVWI